MFTLDLFMVQIKKGNKPMYAKCKKIKISLKFFTPFSFYKYQPLIMIQYRGIAICAGAAYSAEWGYDLLHLYSRSPLPQSQTDPCPDQTALRISSCVTFVLVRSRPLRSRRPSNITKPSKDSR